MDEHSGIVPAEKDDAYAAPAVTRLGTAESLTAGGPLLTDVTDPSSTIG